MTPTSHEDLPLSSTAMQNMPSTSLAEDRNTRGAARLPTSRQVAFIDGTGKTEVRTEAIPEIKPGQILVRVHASLLSPGTELGRARQHLTDPHREPVRPLTAFGYQNAGEVVAVSEGVTQFKAGDRVACMGGGYALHSSYALVPQNLCAALPEGVTYEQGAYGHLAMTAIHAVRRAQPALGEYALVVGLGLVGQLAAQMLHLAGTQVMAWDTLASRVTLARSCQVGAVDTSRDDGLAAARAFTAGNGFDLAVMAIGGDGSTVLQQVRQAMMLSSDGHEMGRLVMVGGLTTTLQWANAAGNLDFRCAARTGAGYHDEDWEHGRTQYPRGHVRWHTQNHLELALRWMQQKRLDVDRLTTHRFPLERVADAVDLHLHSPNAVLGTILTMTH